MMIDQQSQPIPLEMTDSYKVKVLLVDDKPENLISLESLLYSEGENITYLFAGSGEEALKIALREELALILLDVQMPGMNGYEVAQYLHNNSKTKDIPIVFVTAIVEQSSHVVAGFEAGAVDFLFKPLHPYITRAKVASFINFFIQKKELEKANKAALQMNRELELRVQDRTKELIKINKDLENFVYTASHDLKAPITNIEGLIKALQETLSDNCVELEESNSILQMIDNSIDRFKNTLTDLTEVAKLQYQEESNHDSVSFQEILDDVKSHIKRMIQESDAEIEEDFLKVPGVVYSRKNLRSIVYNLVSNAIKYRHPLRQPKIKVSTYQEGAYVVLAVQDNGLGIKTQDHHKVFSMFTRLHDHTEGTGVGMTIVKRIVENSDGKIELESELGQGSLFKVYFKVDIV
ncbi:hybrid sensor histidine kinase/response regulator [Pontibacter sp. 13R65]|uniref:hybrid sensor histidine kinase/response regulator n=1 Tax=Pontibacter sp. 13R65 TaxID=3127458 RepID=UPI00301C3018